MPRKVYWDSCVFIGLIQEEPGKIGACREIWREAEMGRTDIVTSAFTFAEVIRARCEVGVAKPLPPGQEEQIDAMLRAKWVTLLVVDPEIGVAARQLLRQHPECKKPSDGIHLASALRLSVDEMHTYDGSDLLKLDGRILKKDTHFLKIRKPTPIVDAPTLLSDMFGPLVLGPGDG